MKIDNFTDPGAKNCCSVLRSCWMPLLAGLFVCLRLCMLAGFTELLWAGTPWLDRAAPVWGLWAPALKEHSPTHSGFPQIKALPYWGYKVDGSGRLRMPFQARWTSKWGTVGKGKDNMREKVKHTTETELNFLTLLFPVKWLTKKKKRKKKRRKLQENSVFTQIHTLYRNLVKSTSFPLFNLKGDVYRFNATLRMVLFCF